MRATALPLAALPPAARPLAVSRRGLRPATCANRAVALVAACASPSAGCRLVGRFGVTVASAAQEEFLNKQQHMQRRVDVAEQKAEEERARCENAEVAARAAESAAAAAVQAKELAMQEREAAQQQACS